MTSRVRHLARCAVIVGVLGLQTWAIVPFADERKERAWPFVPYPMYSAAHRYGERIAVQSLVATPCHGGGRTVLDETSIGASTGKHFRALVSAAGAATGARARALVAAADRVAQGRWCAFEVRYDSVAVSRGGPVRLTPAPVVVARWGRR